MAELYEPIPNKFGLQPGDVLVQHRGFPWVQLSQLATGHPYPHAGLISRVKADGTVLMYENIWKGVTETLVTEENFKNFEVWRPGSEQFACPQEIKWKAIDYMKARLGQMYGYGHLLEIILLHGGHDPCSDNTEDDNRLMVCSELIAMAYWRSGYDLVPNVSERETMPWDLRNPERLVHIH